MKNKMKINTPVIIAYIVIYVFALMAFSLHGIKGMHISSFWRQGSEQITINPSMINGVEFTSFSCRMFMDERDGTEVSVSIQNKDLQDQKAGVILLVSKKDVVFNQVVENEYVKLKPGERMTFNWKVDQSNIVDGKASVRLFLGVSPYHPVHSVRSCIILPWRGPLSSQFLNTWAYPILIVLVLVMAVWVYYKSGLDWQNKKRFFFFIYANVVLVIMLLLLMLKMYLPAVLALPFLFLGVIATFQKSPYLKPEEYKNYIESKK